jgi:hypothetical protein
LLRPAAVGRLLAPLLRLASGLYMRNSNYFARQGRHLGLA